MLLPIHTIVKSSGRNHTFGKKDCPPLRPRPRLAGGTNPPDARLAIGLRQAETTPIWERMRESIDGDALQDVLPKDAFGQPLADRRNQFAP